MSARWIHGVQSKENISMISIPFLYGFTGLVIFAIGLRGLLGLAHFLRKALAFNVMSAGIFVFLVALANRSGDGIPDPVPHAMVLTGIVVSVSATAFTLAMAIRLFNLTGCTDFASFCRRPINKSKEASPRNSDHESGAL